MDDKKYVVRLYPRVSTEDQFRNGHSFDEQKQELVFKYIDNISIEVDKKKYFHKKY